MILKSGLLIHRLRILLPKSSGIADGEIIQDCKEIAMKKRAMLLSVLLLASLLLPATAPALTESDFIPLATGGFGDSANSYSWGLTEFNGDVYVSTGRHHFWSLVLAVGSMIGESIDPGDYIEGPPGDWGDPAWADAHRAEIWRLRNDEWERVCQSGTYVIPEDQAIEEPRLPGPLWGTFPNAYSYRTLGTSGGHIYALGVGTWWPPIANTTILCSASGDLGTWEDVTGNLSSTTNIRGFVQFRDHVYVAVAIPGGGTVGAGGCVVYRKSNDETAGVSWEQVSEVGFGDLRNEEINYIQVFNDCLYASTVNYVTGFEVWKTDGTMGPDGKFVWTQLIKDGFGDTWCQSGLHMEPFGDYLYVGTAVPIGLVLKDQQPVGSRALDIIRIDKDDNAELVVGNSSPSDPPPGWPTSRTPLSGLSAGFGNPLNVYAWDMGVYKDWLVVGTFDMTGILFFLIKEVLGPFAPPALDDVIDDFGGGDLWKTKDGIHWEPITQSGFGNWLNYGFRRVVPVNIEGKEEALLIGTANPFTGVEGGGCEVWARVPQVPPEPWGLSSHTGSSPAGKGVTPSSVLSCVLAFCAPFMAVVLLRRTAKGKVKGRGRKG
jgi:hypothetical protein